MLKMTILPKHKLLMFFLQFYLKLFSELTYKDKIVLKPFAFLKDVQNKKRAFKLFE